MLATAIRRFFAEHALAPRRVVIAVSGGFDSTAMLLAFNGLRDEIELVAGHVNHHLRGEESDADEAFVRELCRMLDVPLHVAGGTLDAAAVRHRGIEAAAREVRFARLQEIRRAAGADFIATAHQRNDQAETVLMRLMSGGSPAALRGIHPVRDDGIIRPMLNVSRQEIVAFLEERGIQPRVDRSNSDPRFLRNRVRKLLENAPDGAIANLASTAAHARAQWRVLERAIDAAEDVVTDEEETRFRSLPEDAWLRQALLHRHIVRLDSEHARDVSATDLERLVRDGRPRITVTKDLELVQHNGGVTLRRIPRPIEPFELPLTIDQPAHIELLGVVIQVTGQRTTSNGQRIQLPANATPTFTVRNRRPGDRFHPLGYPAPAKLKSVLISHKIPRQQRDRLPLVVWNGEIVWVAGVAVSERFKTSGSVGEIYELSLEPSRIT
jgi:tRNA(Ile)-lysidine synthase